MQSTYFISIYWQISHKHATSNESIATAMTSASPAHSEPNESTDPSVEDIIGGFSQMDLAKEVLSVTPLTNISQDVLDAHTVTWERGPKTILPFKIDDQTKMPTPIRVRTSHINNDTVLIDTISRYRNMSESVKWQGWILHCRARIHPSFSLNQASRSILTVQQRQ
jgi:hypothetical protein